MPCTHLKNASTIITTFGPQLGDRDSTSEKQLNFTRSKIRCSYVMVLSVMETSLYLANAAAQNVGVVKC
jgi:hypothetical protein